MERRELLVPSCYVSSMADSNRPSGPGPRACAAGLVVRDGRVLLGLRASDSITYPGVWDVFGGHLEAGETAEQALRRELREELDIELTRFHLIGRFAEPVPAKNEDCSYHFFKVTAWRGPGPRLCGSEHSEIRWCTLYTRPIPDSMRANLANVNPRVMARQIASLTSNAGKGLLEGWGRDDLFTHGQVVVLVPSDCDRVIGFSRTTGEFLWEAPKNPEGAKKPVGLMGFANGRIFVRGVEFVRCYEAKGGRIAWDTPTPEQFGNGFVTDGAVYASTERALIRIDAESGEKLAEIAIEGSEEPPGSLYFDGTRLYGISPAQVRAYTMK